MKSGPHALLWALYLVFDEQVGDEEVTAVATTATDPIHATVDDLLPTGLWKPEPGNKRVRKSSEADTRKAALAGERRSL